MHKNSRITRAEYHKRKKGKKIKWTFILIISLIIAAFCIVQIFLWNKDNNKVNEITEDINNEKIVKEERTDTAENINPPENKDDDYWNYIKMDMMSVNFDELKNKNRSPMQNRPSSKIQPITYNRR